MGKFKNYFNIYDVYVDDEGNETPVLRNNSERDYSCWKLRVPVYAFKYFVDNGVYGWKCEVVDYLDGNCDGECDYNTKTIRINNNCLWQLSWQQVNDLILHEVAHALCPNHGHDEVWKAKAIEIGCDGNQFRKYELIKENDLIKIVFSEKNNKQD